MNRLNFTQPATKDKSKLSVQFLLSLKL